MKDFTGREICIGDTLAHCHQRGHGGLYTYTVSAVGEGALRTTRGTYIRRTDRSVILNSALENQLLRAINTVVCTAD